MSKSVTLNEQQIAAIEAGVREANRGRLVDHGKLKAKWKKKLATAVHASRARPGRRS